MAENPLRPALFDYLRDLERNNRRDWFQEHKARYEVDVKDPALAFISAFGPRLERISPHFQAIPKAVGGSLFRIYRDTRFSRDKTPYKTHVGIQFRHKKARDAHAPGFYLHLETSGCFAGVGCWHPAAPALEKIRSAIAADPKAWQRAKTDKRFAAAYGLEGELLKTAPRGFDRDHPMIEDLRRKDFIGVAKLTRKRVLAPGFVDDYARLCADAEAFASFLCGALGVRY